MWIRDRRGSAGRRRRPTTVVIAAGQRAERSLADELADAGVAHVVIGGAHGADELDAERAFREGLEAPARIARLIGSRA